MSKQTFGYFWSRQSECKGCLQVNIILLLDSFRNQFALVYAQLLFTAYRLTFPVPVHLDVVEGINNAIPS